MFMVSISAIIINITCKEKRLKRIEMTTITQAMDEYLSTVKLSRSGHTASTYKHALQSYRMTLTNHAIDPDKEPISTLTEDCISWFAGDLKSFAPTTEKLYLTAVSGFYNYLAAENLAPINLPRIRLLIQQRSRRPGVRLPQFPADAIEQVLEYANQLVSQPSENANERLINLRDRAFLLTLADTGLRVHEACNLRRGDLDWNEGKAIIIGKGNRQDVVRFSIRATHALQDYLHEEHSWTVPRAEHFHPCLCLPAMIKEQPRKLNRLPLRLEETLLLPACCKPLGRRLLEPLPPILFAIILSREF